MNNLYVLIPAVFVSHNIFQIVYCKKNIITCVQIPVSDLYSNTCNIDEC